VLYLLIATVVIGALYITVRYVYEWEQSKKEIVEKPEEKPEEPVKKAVKKQDTKKKLIFELVQKAKNTGGDKYSCNTMQDFTIYIPQSISRNNGNPVEQLNIAIY
jgi:hypothetical protein